jgi:sodium transport system ATP-binding protein
VSAPGDAARPAPGAVRVRAAGLTKRFAARGGGVVAVDGVSFEARAGEVLGLLGANGAGKTTTLRLLATMLAPSAGDAEVCGHSVTRAPAEVRRRLGFLSGSTGLYGRLTARELCAYFGELHGLDRARRTARIDELFARFGVDAVADVRCDRLSTGMRQRVSIVRTVLHDPAVIILDEPTAGLDVLAARAIVDFVADCRRRGACVLLSTHVMEEVAELCDRVAVIHGGRLCACEPLAALTARTPSGRVADAFIALVGAA